MRATPTFPLILWSWIVLIGKVHAPALIDAVLSRVLHPASDHYSLPLSGQRYPSIVYISRGSAMPDARGHPTPQNRPVLATTPHFFPNPSSAPPLYL